MRLVACFVALVVVLPVLAAEPDHPVLTWVKRHPTPTSKSPPKLGYEGSYGYDPATRLLIHYGGHNQGGGGEQNSELWTYDLDKDLWKFHEPNDCPPGVCCAQINVFHPRLGKFVRFPAGSGGHGWQSPREINLRNSSVWTYDPPTNTWTPMRPAPDIMPSMLRGAAYDPFSDMIVLHGGEGSSHGTVAYNLQDNSWHKLNSKGGPAASLSQPGFCYDPVNRVVVSFGSQFASDPKTYLFDVKLNEWRVLETKVHPPADKTSPVLAADRRNGVVLCSVRSAEKGENAALETWVLDVAKAEWKKLDIPQPDPSGSRSRLLMYLEDRNLFVMENNTKVGNVREQQIWTFRYRDAPRPEPIKTVAPTEPAIPLGLIASAVTAQRVDLSWRAEDENIAGYVVERAPVAVYSNLQASRVAKKYADSSDDAVGAIRAVGEFKTLTDKPTPERSFTDTAIDLSAGQQSVPEPHVAGRPLHRENYNEAGKPYRFATYAYRIRAVNKLGVSSGAGPIVYTWPAAVQNLRAKEEGTTATRLKWDASPAKGIKGYLVYRHNGRWDKDPIVRLTPEPIAATEFLDEQSGTATRRYEIVVVDALGQLGEPSTPVWSRREYREYYKPYVGEWHQ